MADVEDEQPTAEASLPSTGWQLAGEIQTDTPARSSANVRTTDYTVAGPVTVRRADGTVEEHAALDEASFRRVVHGKLKPVSLKS
jgi:hypothetical protein